VEVSNESKLRRQKYIDESQRKIVRDSYGADYSDFLKSCEINVLINDAFDEKNKLRCLELIQRSNQYNLSTIRYSIDEFNELLKNPEYLKYSIQVYDKYGDYGIVGFVSIQRNGTLYKIKDFVLSCRVAQKMIEETFIKWLASNIDKKAELEIKGYKTERNSPLIKTIEGIGLNVIEDSPSVVIFRNKTSDSIFQKRSFINIEFSKAINE
jgi:FkbH-like protein